MRYLFLLFLLLAPIPLYCQNNTVSIIFEQNKNIYFGMIPTAYSAKIGESKDFREISIVRIEGRFNTVLFANDTTNIIIGTNYTGNIQIGNKVYKVSSFK